MRILGVFALTLILMSFIFVGCGNDDDDNDDDLVVPNGSGDAESFLGFASMQTGSWAEYTTAEDGRYKYEYHGKDTYNGRDVYVMEFESNFSGVSSVSQVWVDTQTFDSVLFVMEFGDQIMKMDISQVPDVPGDDLEDMESDDDTQILGTRDYTTPTGKSVKAIAYMTTQGGNTSEIWAGNIPFGMVKSISNGEVVSELYDFGNSGAVRDISKNEAENAQDFGFPM
jgi:hypothetical protein